MTLKDEIIRESISDLANIIISKKAYLNNKYLGGFIEGFFLDDLERKGYQIIKVEKR